MPAQRPYPNESTEEFRSRVGKKGLPRAQANRRAKNRASRGRNPFQNIAKAISR